MFYLSMSILKFLLRAFRLIISGFLLDIVTDFLVDVGLGAVVEVVVLLLSPNKLEKLKIFCKNKQKKD